MGTETKITSIILKIYNYLSIVVILSPLWSGITLSCSSSSTRIIIPNNCKLLNQPRISNLSDHLSKELKIIVYADSTGCTGCRLQLDTWAFAISEFNEIAKDKFTVIFFLESNNLEELQYALGLAENLNEENLDEENLDEENLDEDFFSESSTTLNYPIYFDPEGYFRKLNNLNHESVFIINSNNEVLFQGEPPFIQGIKERYKKIISTYFSDNATNNY